MKKRREHVKKPIQRIHFSEASFAPGVIDGMAHYEFPAEEGAS